METLCPFCGERTPAEPDAEWVYCIHCYRRIAVDPADVGYHLTPAGERASLLEKLLGDCVCAMEAIPNQMIAAARRLASVRGRMSGSDTQFGPLLNFSVSELRRELGKSRVPLPSREVRGVG